MSTCEKDEIKRKIMWTVMHIAVIYSLGMERSCQGSEWAPRMGQTKLWHVRQQTVHKPPFWPLHLLQPWGQPQARAAFPPAAFLLPSWLRHGSAAEAGAGRVRRHHPHTDTCHPVSLDLQAVLSIHSLPALPADCERLLSRCLTLCKHDTNRQPTSAPSLSAANTGDW